MQQDLSLERIARLILHILFLENSKSVTLILTRPWVVVVGGGWVGGWGGGGVGGGGGIALCKIFIKPKMNQIGDKIRK